MSTLTDTGHRERTRSREHEQARRRLEKQRKFRGDAVAYVLINAFLIVVWALNGTGSFWPGWVMGGWGVLLILDGWNAFYRRPVTDADIDQELRRHG